MSKQLTLLMACLLTVTAYAQNVLMKGVVTDVNREPLPDLIFLLLLFWLLQMFLHLTILLK